MYSEYYRAPSKVKIWPLKEKVVLTIAEQAELLDLIERSKEDPHAE